MYSEIIYLKDGCVRYFGDIAHEFCYQKRKAPRLFPLDASEEVFKFEVKEKEIILREAFPKKYYQKMTLEEKSNYLFIINER